MRRMSIVFLLLTCAASGFAGSRLRVATFRCDVTPDIGEPLIWVTPAVKVEDPLWAKGIVLDDGRARVVLCAVDWCGIAGSTDLLFRGKIAIAAGTTADRVALQSVHQHTAPYIDADAYTLLDRIRPAPLRMSESFLQRVTDRLARAVKEAHARLVPFDQVGVGEARVERVASARRILQDGRLITRYSTGGSNPELAALPQGSIDPFIRTITLAAGNTPLVRLHYYATHPQTFCCDGRVSADFVGAARETLEREENVFQVYFTGCAGDVTVGKYNDGSAETRTAFADRLMLGMKASIAETRFRPAAELRWRIADLALPLKMGGEDAPSMLQARLERPEQQAGQDLYRTAISLAHAQRRRPLQASSLEIGKTWILQLPGEPMLEFQNYARSLRPGEFVALAGYGDISPGYLCTDRAFSEGGYEPSASNAGPGTEARVKEVIRKLLGR